jgi:hypothetical protein
MLNKNTHPVIFEFIRMTRRVALSKERELKHLNFHLSERSDSMKRNSMTITAIFTPTEVNTSELEIQLSSIIISAKEISIIAEELLREFTTLDFGSASDPISAAKLRQTKQAAAIAPRMLSATLQQLNALNSMLHQE